MAKRKQPAAVAEIVEERLSLEERFAELEVDAQALKAKFNALTSEFVGVIKASDNVQRAPDTEDLNAKIYSFTFNWNNIDDARAYIARMIKRYGA